MFCESCGTKNDKEAKFCESCGKKLNKNNVETKKEESNIRFNKMPKKKKIITSIVLLIIIIAVIVLCILLNNPLKKVADKLGDYYANYSENSKQELLEIGKILKNNKDDKKLLENIKKSTHKEVKKWTKNFNTEYKDLDELDKAYDKLNRALNDIYSYFKGLEYMLDYELYTELTSEASTLYKSKTNYIRAKEYELEKEESSAYYNYQKVDELDCYYKKANEYIEKYIAEEVTAFKENAEKIIKIDDNSKTKDILDCYIEQIKYIYENKTTNNIDLSTSKEYEKLYNNAINKIVEYTKKLITELEDKDDYNEIINIIETSIKYVKKDDNANKELTKLKEEFEAKLPDSLLSKYLVSSTWGSDDTKYTKVINDEEYDSNISFEFTGNTENRVYRLNEAYKKFKTKIVRGSDWDKAFNGYFVISGDGKELYKSETITKNSELKAEIEIDVTGVDDLKIEFVTKSNADGWDSFYIYLVEPYLYK